MLSDRLHHHHQSNRRVFVVARAGDIALHSIPNIYDFSIKGHLGTLSEKFNTIKSDFYVSQRTYTAGPVFNTTCSDFSLFFFHLNS